MVTRIITSIVALILLITFIAIGGTPLIVFFVFVSAIANFEMRHALGLRFRLGDIISSIFITFIFFVPPDTILAVLVLYVFTELVMAMFIHKYYLQMVKISAFSIIYAVVPFLLLSRLINFSTVSNYYLLAFIIPWTTDTFAYFAGVYFGKRKLFPTISPKKTLAGYIGGFVGSVIVSFIFSFLLVKDIKALPILLIIILASFLAQLGDLAASYIKREAGIKDFSSLLPGHGGILDRFDSVIVVVSFLYLCQLFL